MKRHVRGKVCFLLALWMGIWAVPAAGEVPFVLECTAYVFEQPDESSALVAKMRAGQVYYTSEVDRRGTWVPVYSEAGEFEPFIQGWMDESALTLPSSPYPAAPKSQGYVLCERLTIRESPDVSAPPLYHVEHGMVLDVLEETEAWFLVRYLGMERDVIGYALSDYMLLDPTYITMEGSTPVLAYPSPGAKRVGLLDAGSIHAVIARIAGYTVISLRGASGFIPD